MQFRTILNLFIGAGTTFNRITKAVCTDCNIDYLFVDNNDIADKEGCIEADVHFSCTVVQN